MKIQDVIRATSVLLNLEKVTSYCDNDISVIDEELIKKVKLLTELTNLVVSELSSTYVYLYTTENVAENQGKVYFSHLTKHIIKVEDIYDDRGNSLEYKIHPEYAIVHGGAHSIRYAYLAERKEFDQEIGYNESQISVRVMAYALASEYCLTERRFDEAVMWHKRYMDALSMICLPKTAKLKARSFC